MQPKTEPPQQDQQPTSDDVGEPGPMAARANAAAANAAAVLALFTTVMFSWYALDNVIFLYEVSGGWSALMLVNVLGGAVAAGTMLVAAGFTYVRRIAGAWTLFGMCASYIVAIFVMAPLLWGTPIGSQVEWIFGFDKSNGVAIGLAVICCILTGGAAAIAAAVKSYESGAR